MVWFSLGGLSSLFDEIGTTNFVHGIPYVAISIGFTVSREPTIGVVLNPFTAQLYTAIRYQGSYLTLLSATLTETLSTTPPPALPIATPLSPLFRHRNRIRFLPLRSQL